MLEKTPKRLQPKIKDLLRLSMIRLIWPQIIRNLIITDFEGRTSKAIAILKLDFNDVMAVMNLPVKYRRKLRTINSIERINEQIIRRERVARIFPHAESVIRLIGALLIEQDEKWATDRRYFGNHDHFYFSESVNTIRP